MERSITVEYWQELPSLIEALKRANSQIVYEWNKEFDPTIEYVTSINFQDVRIRFKGEEWAIVTRLYKLFCEEFDLDLNFNNYVWLATHTKVINNALLGDKEFNRYVISNGGMIEAEEFVKYNKLVIWHGEDFELYYNYRDMEMIQRLGMEVRPNQFQFRSKSGYYLPIKIHIKYNDILTRWLRGEGRNLNKYEIVHTPEFTILATEKSSLYDLAKYMYKEEGLSELIVKWVDELDKTEYKVTIGGTKVYIKDVWREENKEYVRTARRLNKVSPYELEAFRIQEVLNHSKYDEDYGIELNEGIYSRLTIDEGKLLRGLTQVKANLYEKEEGSLGKSQAISIPISDIKIKTPYQVIKNGEYSGATLPLVEELGYNKGKKEVNTLDTDLRVVLRKSSIPKKSQEFTFEDIYNNGEGLRYEIRDYPEVEVDLEKYGVEIKQQDIEEDRNLTGTDVDFKYIPYVISVENLDSYKRITYIDGDIIELPNTSSNIRARLVFKDRVGVEIDEDSKRLTELLLSLSTDRLENIGYDYQSKEGLTEKVIEEWLDALITGNVETLYETIKEYPLSDKVEVEEDGELFEIFGFDEEEEQDEQEEVSLLDAIDEELRDGMEYEEDDNEDDDFDLFEEFELL